MNRIGSFLLAYSLIAPVGASYLAHAGDVTKPTFSVRTDPGTGLDQLIITRRGVEKPVGTIKKIRAGEVFFHWGDEDSYARWMGSVGLGDQEFRAMRESFEGQAAGGGFYVSRDPFDSIQFGQECTEVVAPRDLKYFKGIKIALDRSEIELLFPNLNRNADAAQVTSLILEQNGLDAWEYQSAQEDTTWLNILRRDAVGEIHPVSPRNQINAFLKNGPKNIFHWIVYDQNVGLPKIEEFRRAEPDLYAYFLEGDRTPERMKKIRNRLIDEWIEDPLQGSKLQYNRIWSAFNADPRRISSRASTLLNAVRKDFKSDIEASILKLIEKAKATSKKEDILKLKLNGLFMGITPERLGLPPEGLSLAAIPQFRYPANTVLNVQNPFRARLRKAVQFMELSDLVPEIAKGNPAPWKIYDEPGKAPFSDRWGNAINRYKQSTSALDSILMTNTKRMELLIQASTQLTEDPHTKLRGTVAVAEGNVVVQGKRYYRIPAWKKERLLSHPLLVAEVIPDPDHKGSFLARHEYPSARTYRKFETLLSSDLRSDLSLAEKSGKLASGNTPEFQSLTESIIKELLLAAPNDPSFEFYWWASAVFPLGKDTDRALNIAYIADYTFVKNYVSMPLRNWRESLFYSKEEFGVICDLGSKFLDDFINMADSQAIRANPTFPDFYGHSPLFDVYFDRSAFTPPGDPWRAKAIEYLNSEEGQRAISEEKVLISLNSHDCIDLLRSVGRH